MSLYTLLRVSDNPVLYKNDAGLFGSGRALRVCLSLLSL